MYMARVKHKPLLDKYCLKIVFINDYSFLWEGFKNFQGNIRIFVTTKVAKCCKCQPHGDSNHLLSVINTKTEKPKNVFYVKVF